MGATLLDPADWSSDPSFFLADGLLARFSAHRLGSSSLLMAGMALCDYLLVLDCPSAA